MSPTGKPLTVVAVDGNTNAVGAVIKLSGGGSFLINEDSPGSFIFSPMGDFDDVASGSSKTVIIQLTVSDGSSTGIVELLISVHL